MLDLFLFFFNVCVRACVCVGCANAPVEANVVESLLSYWCVGPRIGLRLSVLHGWCFTHLYHLTSPEIGYLDLN